MQSFAPQARCFVCGKPFVTRRGEEWWHWHHINGNPFDNRKSNLVPLHRLCHDVVHLLADQLKGQWHPLKRWAEFSHRKNGKTTIGREYQLAALLKGWVHDQVCTQAVWVACCRRWPRKKRVKLRDQLIELQVRTKIRVALRNAPSNWKPTLKSYLRALDGHIAAPFDRRQVLEAVRIAVDRDGKQLERFLNQLNWPHGHRTHGNCPSMSPAWPCQ